MSARKELAEERKRTNSGEERSVLQLDSPMIFGRGDSPEGNEVHIPDYVMHDFGFPETRRNGG
jgi:hypothetical protein